MVTAILTVVVKVAELFLMIGVGAVCFRVGMLTRRGVTQLTTLLLYIVAPCLIVSSLAGQGGGITPGELVLSLGLAVLAHILAIGLSLLFFRREPLSRRRVLRFSLIYSNTGFMGMPLVQAVVGEEGVVYASVFIAVFNVFVWTHGYSLMSGGQHSGWKKVVLNPGVLALVVGLPLFFLGWDLPGLIQVPIDSFAALNTPLAMVIIGCNIARIPFREMFSDRAVFSAATLRLLLIPAVFLGAAFLCGPVPALLLSSVIQAAAPAAANTVLFATRFGGDDTLAAKMVAVSSLASVITLPLIVTVTQAVSGAL